MKKRVLSDADLQAIKDLMGVVVEEKLEENQVVTKEDIKHLPTKNEFYERMDKFSKEIEEFRQEEATANQQTTNHEERITALEEIHPDGQHASK